MTRTCQFAFAGRSGPAEWLFDEVSLVVAPTDGRPLAFPVQEMAGVAGDGYTVELAIPGPAAPAVTGEVAGSAGTPAGTAAPSAAAPAPPGARATAPLLSLSKLGAEGPTLLDALQRTWIAARAKALRLGGSGEGKPFSGMVSGIDGTAGIAAVPFRALLFEDVMVIAREGRDLDPVFIALTEAITFDEATYTVHITEWPGREIVLSKLGKPTEDLLGWLRKHRETLSNESGAALAASVPSLSSAYRGILAGDWPPGRLRTLQDLSTICPGFEQAFRDVWLAACVRKDEGQFLLDWAGPGSCWLGCSRETGEGGESLLWLLAEKNAVWFLEALTGEDRATYHFSAGGQMPALVSRLLCAPQFSKEALYGPPETLTGERADLAIAAQFLGFLADLRTLFRGRVIHTSLESWQKDMGAAAGG
jgi:hypothetical protein